MNTNLKKAAFTLVLLPCLLMLAPPAARAQTTGFNQAGAGPFDYNTPGNWVGGTINGIWDSSLTLTAAQAVTFGADTSLGTSLNFGYTGNFALALMADGSGPRTLTLGGDITQATVSNQTVTIGSLTAGNELNVALGATRSFTTNAGKTLTFLNSISGVGFGITKEGAGTLVLGGTAANTYTGTTTVNGGTLSLAKTVNGITTIAGDLVINNATVNYAGGQSNQIADTATVTLNGGSLNFANTTNPRNETIANLSVSAGTATVGTNSAAATVNITGNTTLTGGTIRAVGQGKFAMNSLSISGSGLLDVDATGSGTGEGTARISGLLTITQGSSGAFTPIRLQNGHATLASTRSAVLDFLPGSSGLTFVGDGGNTNSTTIESTFLATGSADRNNIRLNDAGTAFNIGNGGAAVDLIIQPVVTGSGGLAKSGLGTLRMDGNNTYTGATTVSAGTLLINGTQTGGGAYTVSSGGTLGGTGSIGLASNVNATLETGSKLLASSADSLAFTLAGTGILDVSGAVGSGTGSMLFSLDAPASTVVSLSGGGLNIGVGVMNFDDFGFSTTGSFGVGTYTLFGGASSLSGSLGTSLTGTVGGLSSTISLSGNNVILTVVPEPAAWMLTAVAGTFFITLRRRKTAE